MEPPKPSESLANQNARRSEEAGGGTQQTLERSSQSHCRGERSLAEPPTDHQGAQGHGNPAERS